ncbi:galactose-3-o-sulfotransferase 3 [Plakobranchus ocellatus]|uniref:Galactose-3-o-sulfotransferase 3 n=1 Tax=Plakobranchus ocellatus TaxID=259542 RepID=A0AAV3Z745_9GAST|nr:galactose-3-o-sulfotransferase 3 [Plakobranchus ocellatus]
MFLLINLPFTILWTPLTRLTVGTVSERRQVVFAKVHKAASSTIQNIMLRFAMARNLSVLLPDHSNVLNEKESKIDPSLLIAHQEGEPFDMLCNHLIFNESEIGKYVPETAFRVAILREPMKQALSALQYYTTVYPSKQLNDGLSKHPNDPINGFLQHPEDFIQTEIGYNPARSFVNNRMSIDLGFDLDNFEASKRNTTKIQAFLKKLESQFDVILISDYFDESIVLLRRLLRWSFKDIIHFRVNTAHQEDKFSIWNKKPIMNTTTIERFRQWDRIDYDLYEYFLPIFKEKIRNEYLFQNELKAFQKVQQDILSYCLNDKAFENLRIPKNLWTEEFIVSRSECALMSLSEIKLVDLARNGQLDRYNKKFQGKKNDSQ